MRKGIITDIDWEYIGAVLANEGDEEQAKFLNSMAKEMLSWGTRFQAEMQVTSIASKLNPSTKKLLKFESEDQQQEEL